MAKIRLDEGPHGTFLLVEIVNGVPTGNDKLIQTDWAYPGVAGSFGYIPCTECDETDGTIDCEHHTASEMIQAAQEWLDDNIGEVVDDPGYFS